jgi:hypothetical protein
MTFRFSHQDDLPGLYSTRTLFCYVRELRSVRERGHVSRMAETRNRKELRSVSDWETSGMDSWVVGFEDGRWVEVGHIRWHALRAHFVFFF